MEIAGDFLPLTATDMRKRGWNEVDVVFITGDAYVDHPSFGAALLCRMMEADGYKVGIVSQPNWDSPKDFLEFGKPKLCCMISAGNIDSMVSRYTANLKVRNDDPYSPQGKGGKRPDRAVITYCTRARQAFGKETPIIIGGIEASLRKFAHYDYWSNTVRRSILLDSKADLLVYGMGELQTKQILQALGKQKSLKDVHHIPGTVYHISQKDFLHVRETRREETCVELPSYEAVSERDVTSNTPTPEGLLQYATAHHMQMLNENPFQDSFLAQQSGDRVVIANRPMRPLTQAEFDDIQELPYTRQAHPSYEKEGGIPALQEVKYSITSNRGCFGSCSFCAITSHQGRMIVNRSIASLVRETKKITQLPDFKGYINDVGGPTANFQDLACEKQRDNGPCTHRACLYPTACSHLKDSHPAYIQRLEAIRKVPKVKKVFIRSGIRYDYLLQCKTKHEFIDHVVSHHVSGQLRIAPEHVDPNTLGAMGKPSIAVYEEFVSLFTESTQKKGLPQYCIPYFIAAHPGSTLESAIELALFLHKTKFVPEQVQEFYPTPGTVSTCMYYTGIDPRPHKHFAPIYVPKGRERTLQRALLQYSYPEQRTLVREALIKAKREDLIGILLKYHKPVLHQRSKRGKGIS